MIRVELRFADGRPYLDVPVDVYIRLPDELVDGIARFYSECSHCGVKHELDTGAQIVAAIMTEAICPAKGIH